MCEFKCYERRQRSRRSFLSSFFFLLRSIPSAVSTHLTFFHKDCGSDDFIHLVLNESFAHCCRPHFSTRRMLSVEKGAGTGGLCLRREILVLYASLRVRFFFCRNEKSAPGACSYQIIDNAACGVRPGAC